MAAAMVGLQFGLPGAVAVRHGIDVERGDWMVSEDGFEPWLGPIRAVA